MSLEINNENGEMDVPEKESQNDELKPVKSKSKKILSAGLKLLVGGAVVTVIGSVLLPSRTMGSTRSSRLEYEKRKAENDKAVQAEIAKEEQIAISEDKHIEE